MKDIRVLSLGVMAMDTVLLVSDLFRSDGFGFIESERMVLGGSASNASVAMVQLGLSVRQAGKIGDDHAGEDLLRSLVDEGVDVSPMVTKKGGHDVPYLHFRRRRRGALYFRQHRGCRYETGGFGAAVRRIGWDRRPLYGFLRPEGRAVPGPPV